MADDKREGSDDLFEDLDKFFAPIKDVEWPEPEGEEEPPPSHEEHVAVHVPAEPEVEPEAPGVDDDAWYDAQSMEPVREGPVTVPDATLPGQAGLFVEDHEPPEEEREPDHADASSEPPPAFVSPDGIGEPTEH